MNHDLHQSATLRRMFVLRCKYCHGNLCSSVERSPLEFAIAAVARSIETEKLHVIRDNILLVRGYERPRRRKLRGDDVIGYFTWNRGGPYLHFHIHRRSVHDYVLTNFGV